ncbi:oxygen-independent coproporphyrinogen III oxidase [Clostridiales bacterium COT073_COT-073]|nr:oxygen-independent coproporphyrinogen III oxidase [Clostridiales bacterium COT073_COT-073]
MKTKEFGLYIHIPFCVRKCSYCDFLSMPTSERLQEDYVKALITEISLTAEKTKGKVKSLYFGGGTPSLLTVSQMERIAESLYSCFSILPNAEISMEVNPGTIEKAKLNTYHRIGINRLSMGLQSTQNDELQMLGRIHTYEEFEKNYQLLRVEGFRNISIDLLLAIPNQSQAQMLSGLQRLINLRPEHISVYSLILEEGTKFYEIRDSLNLPTEENEREMYWAADAYLIKNGYYPYEISNYALKGRECQHNLLYWSDEDYIGLGIGAASYWNGVRWKNTSDIKQYIKSPLPSAIREITQEKDEQRHLEDYLFLGLRKREGILIDKLNQSFDQPLQKIYALEIEKMQKQGLLEIVDGYLRLTQKGIDFSNMVFAEFLR